MAYLYHLKVNGVPKALQPLEFGAVNASKILSRDAPESEAQAQLARSVLDARPIYSGFGDVTPYSITSNRGRVPYFRVDGPGTQLLIRLKLASPPAIFNSMSPNLGTVKVETFATGSVLHNAGPKTLLKTVLHNLYAPTQAGATPALREAHVKNGWHVSLLVARLTAFALEHACVPFTGVLRPVSATACVLFTEQGERAYGAALGVDDKLDLNPFTNASNLSTVDAQHNQVVFVGPGTHLRGMALLSALMREGGPVTNQRLSLMPHHAEEGHLLMVTASPLAHDFSRYGPADYPRCIREAVYILQVFNNVPESRFNGYVAHFMENLPLVDTTLLRECADFVPYNVTQGQFSRLPVGAVPANAAAVADAIRDVLPAELAALPNPAIYEMFSHTSRDVAAAIPAGFAGYIGPNARRVLPQAALMLQLGGVVARNNVDLLPLPGYSMFDAVNAPLTIDGLGPLVIGTTMAMLSPHFQVLSARAVYSLYILYEPAAGELQLHGLPNTLNPVALANPAEIALLDATLPAPRLANATWHAPLVAHPLMPAASYAYLYQEVVRDGDAPTTFEDIGVEPRQFDAPMADGRPLNLGGGRAQAAFVYGWAPRITAAVRTAGGVQNRVVGPYMDSTHDALGNVINNAFARVTAFITTVARLWWCKNRRGEYLRLMAIWRAALPPADRDTFDIPDEVSVPLGGIISVAPLTGTGGLWVLAHLMSNTGEQVYRPLDDNSVLCDILNPYLLARRLISFRAAVEAAHTLLRLSPARVRGAEYMYRGFTNRVVTALQNRPGTIVQIDVGEASLIARLLRENLFLCPGPVLLTTVGSVPQPLLRMRTVRDDVGVDTAMYAAYTIPSIVTDQTLACMFGVSRPNYVVSGSLRQELHQTGWNGAVISKTDRVLSVPVNTESAAVDLTFCLATLVAGEEWAISKWGLVDEPQTVFVDAVAAHIVREHREVGRLASRTVYPFLVYVRQAVLMARFGEALPARNAIRALPAFGNARLTLDSTSVMMDPIRKRNQPQFNIVGNQLANHQDDSYPTHDVHLALVKTRPPINFVMSLTAASALDQVIKMASKIADLHLLPGLNTLATGANLQTPDSGVVGGAAGPDAINISAASAPNSTVLAAAIRTARPNDGGGISSAARAPAAAGAGDAAIQDLISILSGMDPTVLATLLSTAQAASRTATNTGGGASGKTEEVDIADRAASDAMDKPHSA